MKKIANIPLVVFAVSFIVLWLSAHLGRYCRRRQGELDETLREDLGVI